MTSRNEPVKKTRKPAESPSDLVSRSEVVRVLRGLLEEAIEVEASMGEMPTAEEALDAALTQVAELQRRP